MSCKNYTLHIKKIALSIYYAKNYKLINKTNFFSYNNGNLNPDKI